MRVRSIEFGDDEYPESIAVTMTLREAALIVRMIGPTSHVRREEIQSDGGSVGSDIHDALTGMVFNHFWEDGIREVSK